MSTDERVIDVGSYVRRPGWVEWGTGRVFARGTRDGIETAWVEFDDRTREVNVDLLTVVTNERHEDCSDWCPYRGLSGHLATDETSWKG